VILAGRFVAAADLPDIGRSLVCGTAASIRARIACGRVHYYAGNHAGPRHRAGPSSRSQTRANIENQQQRAEREASRQPRHESIMLASTLGLPMVVVDKRVRIVQAPSLRRSQASIMQQDYHRKLPDFRGATTSKNWSAAGALT